MKTVNFLVVIILTIVFPSTLEAFQKKEPRSVKYIINPVQLDDRVNLKIHVEVEGSEKGKTIISLPVDRYGTRNIYQAISEFDVEKAEVGTVYEEPELREIFHKPNERLQITYTISFDPEMSSTSSFSPIIEPEIFHFFGPQWQLKFIDEDSTSFDFQIEFKNVPETWGTYSNLPQKADGSYHIVSTQKDFSPFIAGGKYDHNQIKLDGNPVDVIISYHFAEDSLLDDLAKLISFQREFFNFKSNEHYLVSITYREDIFAGTALKNSFISLLNTMNENNRHRSLVLLAHETLHNWIPQAAELYVDEQEVGSEFKSEFFNEGITTYAPKIMLYDQGLISKEKVIDLLNASLLEYARNPYREISFEKMQKDILAKKYGNYHERVAYFKGDIIGFKWDNIIRSKTGGQKNLLHFLKEVIQKAEENNGKIRFNEFFGIAELYGLDAKRDWEKYILKGDRLSLRNVGWLGKEYKLTNEKNEFYELGFDSGSSRSQKTIKGTIEGSNAYKSGVRDGMKIIDLQTKRDKDEEVKLIVNDNGTEKIITYFPKRLIEYQKIVPR